MSLRIWLADFLKALGGAASEELDHASKEATDDTKRFAPAIQGVRIDDFELATRLDEIELEERF
jgi:hypothetical protein